MKSREIFTYIQKYYYGKTIFTHTHLKFNEENKKLVSKILLELLKDITDFLQMHNIRYFISNGTLLGAFREKKLIDTDDDIDIRIHKDDWETYKDKISKSKFLQTKYINHTHKTDQIHHRFKTPHQAFHVDIVPSDYEAINEYDGKYVFKKCNEMFNLPTESMQINDLIVQAPNKKLIKSYLEDTFGKDYMTPKHNSYKSKNIIIGVTILLYTIISITTFISLKYNLYLLYPIIFIFSYITFMATLNNFFIRY